MSVRNPDQKYERNGNDSYKLELVGLTADSDRPKIVVQAVDSGNAVIHKQLVGGDGRFTLPDDVLKRAHRVVLGAPDDKGSVRAEASISYRASEFTAHVTDGTLALAEAIWSRLRFRWTCVSGRVRVCRRRPWWFRELYEAATRVELPRLRAPRAIAFTPAVEQAAAVRAQIAPSLHDLILWPFRCAPVCMGTVEVYRRTCCCWPLVFDPRIDDVIRDLEIYVERLPRPPRPRPGDPPPIDDPLKTPFFPGGALNELAINATADLHVLRALPRDQASQYIQERPYLLHHLCSCGQPAKVASGLLHLDGSFSICWIEPWRLTLANCYDQYAYVVKQTIGGTTTTIYDGLAAGAWFAAGTHPTLTSYNVDAFSCNETGHAGGDAFVLLDLIGDTEAHELTTPPSTGWDRVAAPSATSGLLFPNPGVGGHLRNLGGAVELTFEFSLGMKTAVDAHYYRVSYCKADASGNPTGARAYFKDGLLWDKIVGAEVVPELLGPAEIGGEKYLYRIPYNEPWVGSTRHHAVIDTTQTTSQGNYLVTLEVFDVDGKRLRPLGTPASGQPGTELAKPFKYRRWFQPAGSPGDDTVEVPYAALTHLLCWDNHPPVADITRLVMNGAASDAECQFLDGPGNSRFAIEYRAYVDDERFQYAHGISWLRGLNGSAANGGAGTLPTPASPSNVGEPPAPPQNSDSNTFAHMLTRLDPPALPKVLSRCSFAVTLTTWAKTTNGADLSYPYDQETAAFALAIE